MKIINLIRNIILIIVLLIISNTLFAQHKTSKKTYFSINASYGISGLSGTIDDGKIIPSQGMQISLEGSYFFSPFVGLGIGTGYADYASTATVNTYNSSLVTEDEDGDNLEYRIKASNLSVKEKISAFEFPLFLAFRRISSIKLHFETNLGVKVSVPVSSSYNYSSGTITTTGYYEKYNIELIDMPNHGFQTTDIAKFTGKLSTKTAFSVFARFGFVVPIDKFRLHVSAYGSYGLSSILQQKNSSLVTYPNIYQSATSLSEKVNLFSGGLRIGIGI